MKSVWPLRLTAPDRPMRLELAGRLGQASGLVSDHAYSRRVALLKRVLPAIGVTLLLLVAIWPRLAPLIEGMRLAFPAIDLREARELRMLNLRYLGTDHENRPFVVTAASGRQVPDHQELMSLQAPRADMKTHNGKDVVVSAATGIYQSQAQILDLFGDVTVIHQDGTRFVTDAARLNIANSTAQGTDPVQGHGPSGDIKAQGFRILGKGDTVFFTGRTDLVLKGARQAAATPAPPALPPLIEHQAAAVEAHAAPMLAGPKPAPPERRATRPEERHPERHRRVISHRVVHPHPARSAVKRKAGRS